MENKETKRKSNFELMRIVSMLMIVLWHVIMHGKVHDNCANKFLDLILLLIQCYLVVHVNSFILLSGYFQSEKKFNGSKFWKLLNSCWFYRVIILIIFLIFNFTPISNATIIKETFIFDLVDNWYMRLFIILYLLSPFINKLITNINRKDYKKLLIVLFVILCIIPFVTAMQTFSNNGYSLYSFIFLYLVGAYFKRYPISKSTRYKNYNVKSRRLLFLGTFLLLGFMNFGLSQTYSVIMAKTSAIDSYVSVLSAGILYYNNPIVVIQSMYFFFFFETLDIDSKFINKVASTTLGVYLIHDNILIRSKLYKWMSIDGDLIFSFNFIWYLLLCTIVIFTVCSSIEFGRKYLFKKIYDLKISKKCRDKYHKIFDGYDFI